MSHRSENVALRRLRGDMSRARLAAHFETVCRRLRRETDNSALFQAPSRSAIEKQIMRLEQGTTEQPGELYMRLYCEYFSASRHELFGELRRSVPPDDRDTFAIRNNKLIPMFVGPDVVARAVPGLAMERSHTMPTECHRTPVEHPRSLQATLWAWPFGVVLFHIVENVAFPTLAELAVWHRRIYDEQMEWARSSACNILDVPQVDVQYAMPVNWLERSIWADDELDTALRVLTMPRVLLRRSATDDEGDLSHAQVVERALLRDGFEGAHVADFGVHGISRGVASWAGVAYYPTAPERALSEHEIVSYELVLQALWSYCDWVRAEVEAGRDPDIRPEHGWRLLRALRSIVTTPRREESEQTFPLRRALLDTSGITAHLTQTADTLAELRG